MHHCIHALMRCASRYKLEYTDILKKDKQFKAVQACFCHTHLSFLLKVYLYFYDSYISQRKTEFASMYVGYLLLK